VGQFEQSNGDRTYKHVVDTDIVDNDCVCWWIVLLVRDTSDHSQFSSVRGHCNERELCTQTSLLEPASVLSLFGLLNLKDMQKCSVCPQCSRCSHDSD
jgi:hypothetical protein